VVSTPVHKTQGVFSYCQAHGCFFRVVSFYPI
jgi:hypothetical protein